MLDFNITTITNVKNRVFLSILEYCLRPREYFWQGQRVGVMNENKDKRMTVSLFQDERLKNRSTMKGK